MTEWNKWREDNPDVKVRLEEANLKGFYLLHVNLGGASLSKADLEDALLTGANLFRAIFLEANLRNAKLGAANLQEAKLSGSDLRGTRLFAVDLQGTLCEFAIFNGSTMIAYPEVDRLTHFDFVSLDGIQIDPSAKQLLNCNRRRYYWGIWYGEHSKLKWIVKSFWWISDYGMSTKRIVFTFFGLALVFANIYYHWARLAPPGIVENLFVDRNGVDVQWWLVPLRTLYFSFVTQTTLGFGDMYARAQSICGHILLSLQVILGYVLLGALVTRFAVLFTAGGPAGEFIEKEQKSEQRQ